MTLGELEQARDDAWRAYREAEDKLYDKPRTEAAGVAYDKARWSFIVAYRAWWNAGRAVGASDAK